MFTIDLAWHDFSVNLNVVNVWMNQNTQGYLGCLADSDITLYFSQEPDEATKQHIQDYWTGLSTNSPEHMSYMNSQDWANAVEGAKEDALNKTWDQLSLGQRKILMGITPTRADLGL